MLDKHCCTNPALTLVTLMLALIANTTSAKAAPPEYNHDMSAFETLAKDAQKLVAAGDMAGAHKKMLELEEKWDSNTKDLKKADPPLWNLIDKQMDAALEACDGKDAKKATTELNGFLEKLGRVPKPKKS
jgi:hypothetical protein